MEDIWENIKNLEKEKENNDFESDGIVIKVNKYSQHKTLGENNKFPRWAIAYKFTASVKTSRIIDIKTEVSRSGRITYVAEIEQIYISGSKINRVSLHNFLFIKNMKLNIGDEIEIKKSGGVVPQISRKVTYDNKEGKNFWISPSFCPSCREKLEWNITNIYQICNNKECEQKKISCLVHFSSKNGLDIKGIDKKVIEKLYKNMIISSPVDFFLIQEKKEKILGIAGIEEKKFQSIVNSVNASKKKKLSNLLSALNIPLLGMFKAKKLDEHYLNLLFFLKDIEEEKWEKICNILGKETQKSVKIFFTDLTNLNLVKEISKINIFSNSS